MTAEPTVLPPEPGEWAFDTDQLNDPDEDPVVLVVDTTDTRADEYVVQPMPDGEADWTVATYNPDYDPDDPVVLAVYRSSIEQEHGDVSAQAVIDRYENNDLNDRLLYAFPESRLDKITTDHLT